MVPVPPNQSRASREILCTNLGLVGYSEATQLQNRLALTRLNGDIADQLLLLEHPPTYTLGRRSQPRELPFGHDWYRQRGIEIRETDRGGRVTYHGPGQLVAYPIIDLKALRDDVHGYIRLLERAVVETLIEFNLEAGTSEGLTGVWTKGGKIASLGIHISRGITTHGAAINANNDLEPFEWIVPCGIEGGRVTSIARETGKAIDMERLGTTMARKFAQLYGAKLVFAPEATTPSAQLSDAERTAA